MKKDLLPIRVFTLFILFSFLAAAVLLSPAPAVSIAAAPTSRYFPPPAWILGPMVGSTRNETTVDNWLDYIEANHIPITAFHFDGEQWETCNNTADFRFSDSVIQRLRSDHIRAVFWIVPLIDKRCPEYNIAAGNNYFLMTDGKPIVTSNWEGRGSWINFGNPNAVAYWHSLLDRVITRMNGVIGGFYLDNMSPDQNGSPGYSDAVALDLLNYTRSKVLDGDVVMKSYDRTSPTAAFMGQYAHAAYVNDSNAFFGGMRNKIRNVFATAPLVPAAFSEYPGYNGPIPDRNVYTRRLHWGAFQVIMEDDTTSPPEPWKLSFWSKVEPAYQYYTTLHWELVPYLHSYDELAYETNTPILRDSNQNHFSTELGDEIFVNYVTDYVNSLSVALPPGKWVNFWAEQQSFNGPATVRITAPLGEEPTFVRSGAIIPMQVKDDRTKHGTMASAGSLTVNVFPDGASSFNYFDPTGFWSTLSSQQDGTALTLCTQPAPSQSVIYRIARWGTAPANVTISGGAIGVNRSWGSALPVWHSEFEVDNSQGGWFYDAAAQHLIVKVGTRGADCPTS